MTTVTSVACDPRTAYFQYAGTDSGKVWRTTDAWETDYQVVATPGGIVTALCIDPVFNHLSYPDTAIVYFGTSGGAIYKSADGGQSFSPLPVSGGAVQVILVDPANSNRVMAAMGSKIMLSEDGGGTWVERYDFAPKAMNDMAWQRLGASLVFAALDSAVPVEESFDEALSFSPAVGLDGVSAMSAVSLSPFGGGCAVAMEAGTPSTYWRSSASDWQSSGSLTGNGQVLHYDTTLYQILYGGTTLQLMKSMDESTTWGTVKSGVNVHDISLGPLDRVPTPFHIIALVDGGKIAEYDGATATWTVYDCPDYWDDPTHNGQRFCLAPDQSGVIVWNADFTAVYRSAYPLGGGFSAVLTGLNNPASPSGARAAMTPDPVRGGFRVFSIPAGNVPKEYKSADGITWSGPVDSGSNFVAVRFGVHPAGGLILASLNQTAHDRIRKNSSGDLGDYSDVVSKGTFWIGPDPRAQRWWANMDYTLKYSMNDGATWSAAPIGHGTATAHSLEWFAVDPNGTYIFNLYYQGGGLKLYRSSSGGDSWEDITGKLPAGIATPHPAIHVDAHGHVYFADLYSGLPRVYASRNHGENWTLLAGLSDLTTGLVLAMRGISD